MHELSVAGAVVDTVVRHAAGRRVTAVTICVGHLRQVVPASLAFYLQITARETVCEGAAFEQVVVEAWLRCAACEESWQVTQPAFRCPACGGSDVAVVSGEELEVESIEVEEIACTA